MSKTIQQWHDSYARYSVIDVGPTTIIIIIIIIIISFAFYSFPFCPSPLFVPLFNPARGSGRALWTVVWVPASFEKVKVMHVTNFYSAKKNSKSKKTYISLWVLAPISFWGHFENF